MINTYKYIETKQSKLHDFVMAFFNRIEFETGDFSNDFYEEEFYVNVVSRHKLILQKPFKDIYETIKGWDQEQKTLLCKTIRDSNSIKEICQGEIIPLKIIELNFSEEFKETLSKLFKKLYEDVLKGEFFQPIYGNRREHYHQFKQHPHNDYEFCPICGLVEMKTYADKKTDQYDHYLPKDIYPFSSINFKNLVPTCIDCNSIEVKSNKDILSYTGKVFYPFDEDHKGIDISLNIIHNDPDDLSKIEWEIIFFNPDEKVDEIESWKQIYNIEDRYKSHVEGNIKKWYNFYWENFTDKDSTIEIPDESTRTKSYLRKLKNRKILEYKVLFTLLTTFDTKARDESNTYSLYAQ